jgi:hypothetical protein
MQKFILQKILKEIGGSKTTAEEIEKAIQYFS